MTTTEKRLFAALDASTTRTPAERELADVFVRFRPELLGTLCRLLANRDDALDAFQEAFARCWANRTQLDEIANMRAWVFRVAYNVALDAFKSSWRKRRKPVDVADLSPVSRESSPEENLREKERLALLRVAIERLDDSERAVFLLRQNGALTYEQIAKTTGAPVGTVKTKMRSALAKLRAAAERPLPSESNRTTDGGSDVAGINVNPETNGESNGAAVGETSAERAEEAER